MIASSMLQPTHKILMEGITLRVALSLPQCHKLAIPGRGEGGGEMQIMQY